MRTLLKYRNFLLVLIFCAAPLKMALAGVDVSITIGPPALPVYAQPPCPVDGYIWNPGYWAYGPAAYYWVPGVWVMPPRAGLLWTPGYWGFVGGVYGWHAGYWGPHIGFYGGVHYGFGYDGVGFVGGRWMGGRFAYNTAVMNVNSTVVRNVYVDRTVIRTEAFNHASFNGAGGIAARPTAQEATAMRESHFQATPAQLAHVQSAAQDRNQLASANHGQPGTAAMDSVNGRRFNQQGRIANGIASGQLRAGETRNLENRESNLNHEVHSDRAANGGTLTPQERQQVNRQQNNLSHSIAADKSNSATAHYGDNEVGQRRQAQQQRIANGVRSGQLSPSETAGLEKQQQNINRQTAAGRSANGGKLTAQQRKNINQRQNHASRQINKDKHNDQKAPQ